MNRFVIFVLAAFALVTGAGAQQSPAARTAP